MEIGSNVLCFLFIYITFRSGFRMRIVGDLPTLSVTMSDQKLLDILSLVQNLPLPQGAPPSPEAETDVTVGVLVTQTLLSQNELCERVLF